MLDPSRGLDAPGDLHVEGGVVVAAPSAGRDVRIIDAKDLWVVPGLIDAHVHLREPGHPEKETIETGLAAAAAGGFTAVLAMPNTSPPIDSVALTRWLVSRADELGGTRIHPVPAVTIGRAGRELAPLARLRAAGAVAFSDDGAAVADGSVMRSALRESARLGVPISQHSEDPTISAGGVVNEGAVSRALGLPGWPARAEDAIVSRDICLLRETGGRLHVSHISTAGAVELVRAAKREGLDITAEVTPHHLHLTEELVLGGDTSAKVNPPLRTRADVEACRRALADGTIDIVATDHAPHTPSDKGGGFERAAFGMVGLEIAVGALLMLVKEGVIAPSRMIAAMSSSPAAVFGLRGGTLAPGSVADVTVIDPNREFVVDPTRFRSLGRNTPFAGWSLPGRAVLTLVGGREIFAL